MVVLMIVSMLQHCDDDLRCLCSGSFLDELNTPSKQIQDNRVAKATVEFLERSIIILTSSESSPAVVTEYLYNPATTQPTSTRPPIFLGHIKDKHFVALQPGACIIMYIFYTRITI